MDNRRDVLKYFQLHSDYAQARVKEGIEAYRKGNLHLRVVDKQGQPVACKVSLTQKQHHFRFGANIFMLDEFENAEKNRLYRERFPEALNLATVPIYWSDLEPEEGKPRFSADSPKVYRRPAMDLCVNYCQENGVEPKAHCLNYENFRPAWLPDPTVAEHKKRLEERFRILADRYADKIPSWEVTNETFVNYPEWQPKQSRFYNEDDFVEWSFHTADKHFPHNRLIINDFAVWQNHYHANRSPYYMQIERLLCDPSIRLDAIGFQFHCFFDREGEEKNAPYWYNPVHLYEVMDMYARFGRKLQITEMTLSALSADAEDEAIQCELLQHLYPIFFSHPAMEAIIYWNLVDGYAAFAPQGDMTCGENRFHGGLLRFDMSEKPAYKALKKLVNEEWHTEIRDHALNGEGMLRGFFGEYDLEIQSEHGTVQQRISLLPEKKNLFTIVLD